LSLSAQRRSNARNRKFGRSNHQFVGQSNHAGEAKENGSGMSETMARCLGVASNSARFKAVSLRSTPLICHAWHDIFPRKGGRARAAITVLGVNRCAGARDSKTRLGDGPFGDATTESTTVMARERSDDGEACMQA
jgi:hypothetical protein